eukprot:TRINITY_DN43066_c0_g1_i1.p1 TRINITY_DN43066_c0_g1~~TRINITY_DN43066_c0_g1_i1.p1  ORF type:complete len:354 (+),score=11.90 TRINITY_DN43066_c0_g1_i1:42-1064(+)
MALTDYLYKAACLLVLWDREYFTRLWTTYEVAAFLSIHAEDMAESLSVKPPGQQRATKEDSRSIKILPLTMPSIAIPVQVLVWGAFFASQLTWRVCSEITCFFILALPTYLPSFYYLAGYVRRYTEDRMALLEQLDAFDIARANCREEADRSMILDSVEGKYGSLHDFNEFLTATVATRCGDLFAHVPPYRTVLFLISGGFFFFLDVTPIGFDGPLDVKLAWGIVAIDWQLFACPMSIASIFLIGEYFAKKKPHWSALRYNTVTSFLSVLQAMVLIASVLIPTHFSPTWGVAPILIVTLLHAIITTFTFRVFRRRQVDRHMSHLCRRSHGFFTEYSQRNM